MIKKIGCSILFFPLFLFSQTFTNNLVETAGTWNASISKTITVSGLVNPLSSSLLVLRQVNLHLGRQLDGTYNYSRYTVTLTSPEGTTITIVSGNPNPVSFPNASYREINTKFRDNSNLRTPAASGDSFGEPWHIGYYRVLTPNSFSNFNGENPNGDWTLTISENSSSSGARFNNVDLIFGTPFQINNQISNTSYDACSTPLCISSNEITIATNAGFSPQASDMFNGNTTGCDWNAAQNNSSWFRFTATQSTAKITISGIGGNLQILGVSPGADNNICTPADNIVLTGGCPDDVLNDSYFAQQYSNGSTRNNQLNLSGLTIGQEYFFIVDGESNSISPFYIEMEGANQACNCFVSTPIVNTVPPTCSAASISTIVNYDASLIYTFDPVGPTINAGVISNMNIGTNYTIIASNGTCSSLSSTSFNMTAQLPTPSTPIISSITQPTCLTTTGSFNVTSPAPSGSIIYTIIGTNPVTSSISNSNGVFSGLSSGSYNLTVSQNGCISAPLSIVINPVPGVEFYDFASAIRVNNEIYNTTASSTPSLGGFPGFTAIENQVNPSVGALYLNGVNLGNHNHYSNSLRLTGAEIKTIKNAIGNVCGATMHYRVYRVGEPVLPAFNNVSLSTFIDCTLDSDGVNGPDTYGDTFGPCRSPFYQKLKNYGFDIDLTQRCEGSYKLEVYYSYTGSNCSSSGCDETKYINNGGANFIADFTINPISAPTANSPQDFCSSVNPTIANLTTSSGSNISWYANASGGSTLSSTTSLISGNTYYASQTVLGCESSTRVPVVVSIINQPNAGINSNLAICSTTTLTESMLFNALGGFPDAGGTWTPALTGTGVYTYTVSGVSPCANAIATVNVSFNNPSAPVVGTITQPTCTSSASVALSGLPATGNWTITASPGGATISGSGTTTNFGNLLANTTYTFVVTNDSSCSSVASNNVVVNAIPTAPSLSISSTDNTICSTAPACVPSGTNVVINEVMHWPSGAQGIIGTGREYIELYNPTCSPIDISCFILGTRSAPDSNPTGPLQTGGSIIIPSGTILQPKSHYVIGTSSSSVDPLAVDLKLDLVLTNNCSTGNFVLPNGDGWLALYNNTGQAIDGLFWTVGANQSTKITTPDDDLNDRPCVPNSVGTCTTTGITLLGPNEIYASNSALMNYVGISTPNPLAPTNLTFSRFPDGAAWQGQRSGTISGSNCNGVCDTPTPLSCNGTATVNVVTGSGSYSYQWSASANNQSTQTATALCAGTHTVVVTDLVSNCQSTISVTINTILPTAPTVGAVTQPTCSTATGSFQITGYNAANTYTFTPSVVSISATGLVTANTGTYTFTLTNASGCTSTASSNIVVNPQPTTPTAPTVGAVTQPTCTTATGSFQITGYNAANTYTFTPSVVSISPTGLVTANAGTYTFTVTNASGCTSTASANIVVNPQPTTPAAPTVGAVTQPTCSTATGSFQITGYNAANTYTFTPSVVSISVAGLVTANTGTYTFTVTNASGCTSTASSNIIINSVPPSPVVSTVSGCNGSSFEVTASVVSGVATYQWYDGSSNLLGTTATIVVTQSGTYEVRATVDSCTTIEFVTIQVLPCIIPKGISPNNDGDNDTWDLSGLNIQKAQIFNRYGVEVYSRSNYTNQWDGRTDSGDELPTATYFYVLSFPNGEVKTGWVYINRQQ